jgi:formylglycine-generating enzyme required for sulfatase activity
VRLLTPYLYPMPHPVTKLFATPALPQTTYRVGAAEFTMIHLPAAKAFPIGSDEGEEDSLSREYPKLPRDLAPFALGEVPVTQSLWATVHQRAMSQGVQFDDKKLRANPSYFSGPLRPVENVSWDDAHEFCRVLSLLLDLPPGFFRLPSEVEWEYAARAGTRDEVFAGSNELNEVGWNDSNNYEETPPVGLLAPNAFGFYDLSGNVWEWCEDDWHDSYENAPEDGSAWVDDPEDRAGDRVLRGGSWGSDPRGLPLCLPQRVLAGLPLLQRRLPPRRSRQVKREPASKL